MRLVKPYGFLILVCLLSDVSSAQLNKSACNTGKMSINIQAKMISIRDPKVLFDKHKKHGPYGSLGFEIQQYDYSKFGFRQRLNLDMAAESLYLLGLIIIKKDWSGGGDPDGRFSKSSYFNTIFFEYVPQISLYNHKYFSTGIGGALYDLNYTHYLYDENGQPNNPQKGMLSQYGFYGGWSLFLDVLINKSLTLHTDFYFGYSFYNGSQEKLKKANEPAQGFNSWKITSNLLHKSGLFASARFHQMVNKTSIQTEASRFSFGLGYRFGMLD